MKKPSLNIKTGLFILILLTTLTLCQNSQPFLQEQTFSNNKNSFELYKPTKPKLKGVQYKCNFLADLNFYDLTSLANQQPYFNFTHPTQNYTIYLSICNDIPTEMNCEQDKSSMAIVNNTEDGCVRLSGQGTRVNTQHFVYDKLANDGLTIHFSGGQDCDELRNYDLTLSIQCNMNAEIPTQPQVYETHKCFKHVKFEHKSGCKIDQLSALWEWSQKNAWVIAVPCIIAGFIVCFAGITILKPLYLIVGVFITVSIVWFIFYSTFLQNNTQNWIGWLVLIGSVLLGLGVGILFIKVQRVGAFFLGCIGGFGLGLLIFNSVLYLTDSYVALWSVTLGLALINGVLALYQSEHLIIHASALFGSYFFVMGIGMFAGHYENPFLILELIRFDELQNQDPAFYGYLASSVVLYFVGIVNQYRKLKHLKASRRLAFRKSIN